MGNSRDWYRGDKYVEVLSKDKNGYRVRGVESGDVYDIPRRMKLDKDTIDKLPRVAGPNVHRPGRLHIREDVTDERPALSREAMIIRDSSRKGFGVVLQETKKTFIAEREKRVKVGTVGVDTISQAWVRGQEELREMRKGRNPNAEKRRAEKAEEDRRKLKLKYVLDDALESKDLTASVQKEYRQMLNRFFSDWMGQPVSNITRPMVLARLTLLRKQAKKKGSGAFGIDYGFKALSSVINWAQHHHPGVVKENPVKAISDADEWKKARPRDRIITDRDLPAFTRTLASFRSGSIVEDGKEKQLPPSAAMVADLLELLLFTGLRRGEGAGLRWRDIDFDERTLIARNTKNGTDHRLPLTNSIITILKRRKAQAEGSVYVFPSSKGGHVQDPLFIAKLVEKQSGIAFRPHDLRRTFATLASKMANFAVVKTLLNHSSGGDVTLGYIRPEWSDVCDVMEQISDYLGAKQAEGQGLKLTSEGA